MRKKRFKFKKILIMILLFLIIGGLIYGGISVFDNEKDINSNDKNEEEKEVVVPEVQIVDVNSKSRPIGVMINNIGAARPYHTGLQEAYLVYEIVVEGGITRYLALYKDNFPETVGSVRSARHYFLDYVMENDAFYVHWGWSPQAQSDIKSLGIDNLNGLSMGAPYFFRKNLNVSSEHTGFTNLAEMKKYVESKDYELETSRGLLLDYSATSVSLGESATDATKVNLKYSEYFVTNYVYDSSTNVYKQYVNDKEHKDYETGKQYTVKNIIAYQVGNNNISGDSKGRQDLDNIGTGEGYYMTEGKVIPITWEKKTRKSKTIYKNKETGEKIKVNDGNTWIHIVPNTGNIEIS